MGLPLKERTKVLEIVKRIEQGRFDENDVDNLLMRLRAYAGGRNVFVELSHFVAHNDARDRGLAVEAITAFADRFRFFVDYQWRGRKFLIYDPLPPYVYRLFLAQAHMIDPAMLRAVHRMSPATLVKKVQSSFVLDKPSSTYSVRGGKLGAELLKALEFVCSVLYSASAFHVNDAHRELLDLMKVHGIPVDDDAWKKQTDRVSLAILCLVSGTKFQLADGGSATCSISTSESEFRVPYANEAGEIEFSPPSFGTLNVKARVDFSEPGQPPLEVMFPLIGTDVDALENCDPSLIVAKRPSEGPEGTTLQVLDFEGVIRLNEAFKLVKVTDEQA